MIRGFNIAADTFFATLFRKGLHPRPSGKLVTTKAGSRFINSAKYERVIRELVDHDFEPNESFYQILIGATASFLCETDPHQEDTFVFEAFVVEHLKIIRAAINRIKVMRPQIAAAEQEWNTCH